MFLLLLLGFQPIILCPPNSTLNCDGKGTCTVHPRNKAEMCTCEAGWSGANCMNEVNPCLTRGCNDGECTLTVDWFECTCPVGYSPMSQCGVINDVCFDNPCGDHAVNCTIPTPHDGSEYNCICEPGLFTIIIITL